MLNIISLSLMAISYPLAYIGLSLLQSDYQTVRWFGFWITYPFLWSSMLGFKD